MELWISLGIITAIILAFISMYNRLVALKNRVANAFAQIDVQLQRRYDLIPNLIETAKAYMAHEKDVLAQVTEARSNAQSAKKRSSEDNLAQLKRSDQALQQSLMNFSAVAENYPELQANTTMIQLMEELASTENKVGFARQAFNDSSMALNTYRESFPSNLIAGLFGFKASDYWEVESAEVRRAPKVSF